MGLMESRDEEWKESWRDDYLDTVCAFANNIGGRLIIGKKDNGEIVGVRNAKKLLEEIPGIVKNLMNFYPDVEAVTEDGKTVVIVTVKPQEEAVDLRGVYYTRSGSTTVKITGRDLKPFLMDKGGLVWTDFISKKIKLSDLSKEAVSTFVKRGQAVQRISSSADPDDTEAVLRRYELMTDEGITNAAAVLFLDKPMRASFAAVTKIGLFAKKGGRLMMEDIIDGPVIFQPERTLERLLDRYVQPRFYLDGIVRKEKYRYPVNALRESLLNAIQHRQYMDVQETTVSVFPDCIEICNPGSLPKGWTADELREKHESKPANPLIAQVFHDMGTSEKWGVGISAIYEECEKAGMPRPVYKAGHDRTCLTFISGPWSETDEDVTEPVVAKGLTPLELEVYKAIREGKYTTAEAMAASSGVSVRTVKNALYELRDRGLIHRIGSNKKGVWEVILRPAEKDA